MLPPVPSSGQGRDEEATAIVHYRPLGAALRVEPETGQVDVAVVEDPLAGEVFETAEFLASQEFVDQGGTRDTREATEEDASEDTEDGQASRRDLDVD